MATMIETVVRLASTEVERIEKVRQLLGEEIFVEYVAAKICKSSKEPIGTGIISKVSEIVQQGALHIITVNCAYYSTFNSGLWESLSKNYDINYGYYCHNTGNGTCWSYTSSSILNLINEQYLLDLYYKKGDQEHFIYESYENEDDVCKRCSEIFDVNVENYNTFNMLVDSFESCSKIEQDEYSVIGKENAISKVFSEISGKIIPIV